MSWKNGTIGDLVELQRGHDLTAEQQQDGDVPVIGSAGPNGFHNVALAKGPGFTIGRSGGSIGKVTFVAQDYWPHNTCIYAKDFKGNDPRFVAYKLSLLDLAQLNSGAAQPSLNRNFVYGVRVRFPEPEEQRRIASILSTYDDLIENNRKRIKLLERAARLLYKEWFVRLRFPGCDGVKVKDGVPEGWEKGAIEDFYHTSSGGTPSRSKPEYYEGDINWVKTQELNEDFILETEEKITELAIKNSSAKIYPPNTLLVSMYGGTNIGRAALLGTHAACNQACCALLPKVQHASVHHAFLFFGTIREQLIAISQGAAQTNISQQIVKGLSYTLPSEFVMQEFSARVLPVFDQMRTLQAMNRQLTRARDLLLPRLMSGKVTV